MTTIDSNAIIKTTVRLVLCTAAAAVVFLIKSFSTLLYSTPLKRKKRRERDDVVWCIDAADEIMKCFSLSRQFRPPGVDEQEQLLLSLSLHRRTYSNAVHTHTTSTVSSSSSSFFCLLLHHQVAFVVLCKQRRNATQRSLLPSFLLSARLNFFLC